MKKAKLIWTRNGYKVEHCTWKGYYAEVRATTLIHDLFEHRPIDEGTNLDEIRAIGAKIYFDGVYTYQDSEDGKWYFDNKYTYKYQEGFRHITYHRKGKRGIPKLIETYKALAPKNKLIKLINEGYNHAKQYNSKAYFKAFTINFKRYHEQKVHLEISLVTGRILKKIPVKV